MPLAPTTAVAAVAAALNNADQSKIASPSDTVWKVAFPCATVQAAVELAHQLARLGIIPTTLVNHNEFGTPAGAEVRIWSEADQTRLLAATGSSLRPDRLEQLQTLVLVRKPIPDETLERIWNAHQRGWSDARIRDELEKGGFVEGMGKRWTVAKVRAAIRTYRERLQPREAAA
jgi:hypothetical protein